MKKFKIKCPNCKKGVTTNLKFEEKYQYICPRCGYLFNKKDFSIRDISSPLHLVSGLDEINMSLWGFYFNKCHKE